MYPLKSPRCAQSSSSCVIGGFLIKHQSLPHNFKACHQLSSPCRYGGHRWILRVFSPPSSSLEVLASLPASLKPSFAGMTSPKSWQSLASPPACVSSCLHQLQPIKTGVLQAVLCACIFIKIFSGHLAASESDTTAQSELEDMVLKIKIGQNPMMLPKQDLIYFAPVLNSSQMTNGLHYCVELSR